jgi:putative endonuclease
MPSMAKVVTWASMAPDARRAGVPEHHVLVTESRRAKSSPTRADRQRALRDRRRMSSDLRHHLGRLGEDAAAAHMERLGYRIVARNHRTRHGELDLVCFADGVLVFVEVKTRRGRGQPWDALGPRKQGQVRRMAAGYLAEAADRPLADELRFDAIGIVFDPRGRMVRLDHIEGAF